MRNQATSLPRVPNPCAAGDKIHLILDEIIAEHETLQEPVRRILADSPTLGFPPDMVSPAQTKAWEALGISRAPLATSLQLDLIVSSQPSSGTHPTR